MNNSFITNILTDLKVELMDEFDRNFERKAFFDKSWPDVIMPNKRGSLMARSNALRRSIKFRLLPDGIHFYSSSPYALIQNEGGVIVITAKMKKYFWAMYYSLTGGVVHNIKTRAAANTAKNKRLTGEAAYWKAMALKKVGSKLVIRQRQFIGNHPQVDLAVHRVCDANFKELATTLKNRLKP